MDNTSPVSSSTWPMVELAPLAPVTSLRWFGTDEPPVLLPTSQTRFTLGAGPCNVRVPHALATNVASLHAVLDRDGPSMRVRDRDTASGTYPAAGSARLASFDVRTGQSFWIADTRVLATDTHLEVLRPTIAACFGLARHDAIDEMLALVATGRPLALVGPRGTDALRLAEAIHRASPQRVRPHVIADHIVPDLRALAGTSVFLDLDRLRRVPDAWLRTAFDPARALRIVFSCSNDARIRHTLDHHRECISTRHLVPLAHRPADILPLIERHWIDDLGSPHHLSDLGHGLAALEAYDWPGNLDELRLRAVHLLAYLEYGGLRPAAAMLGIAHQTLAEHFRRINFPARPWHASGGLTARDSSIPSFGWHHRPSAADVWHALRDSSHSWLAGLEPLTSP